MPCFQHVDLHGAHVWTCSIRQISSYHTLRHPTCTASARATARCISDSSAGLADRSANLSGGGTEQARDHPARRKQCGRAGHPPAEGSQSGPDRQRGHCPGAGPCPAQQTRRAHSVFCVTGVCLLRLWNGTVLAPLDCLLVHAADRCVVGGYKHGPALKGHGALSLTTCTRCCPDPSPGADMRLHDGGCAGLHTGCQAGHACRWCG